MNLSIISVPTYDKKTMAIDDATVYPLGSVVTNPLIEIIVPGYPDDPFSLPFTNGGLNTFVSSDFDLGTDLVLPDGIYYLKYTATVDSVGYEVSKTIIRIDELQEKYDEAFLTLDMLECDRKIKMQSKSELNTIYFFIQGSVAAANNCAVVEAERLYGQAYLMLERFILSGCTCCGSNYVINF